MIYIVSNQKDLAPPFPFLSFHDFLSIIKDYEGLYIAFDTETTGLNPRTDTIKSMQFGFGKDQYYVDDTCDYKEFKSVFEDKNRIFIIQNAKFDLKFLFSCDIFPCNIYDTFLAEKILWLGYPPGNPPLSLDYLCQRRLGVNDVDKGQRGIVLRKGHCTEAIQYGCKDVEHLEALMNDQIAEISAKGMTRALELENKFVIPLAYSEWCGIKIDVEKWKDKMKQDASKLQSAIDKLNQFVLSLGNPAYISEDNDIFKGYSRFCNIKWSSQKQVIPLFKELGLDLLVKDKATGKTKYSIDAKVLKPQKDRHPIVPVFLEYQVAAKLCSTYGQSFLDKLENGRIYTNYFQLGTGTGRLSSGGKDGKVEYFNIQNLPHDELTRSCFVSEKGWKFLSCDYDSQESRVIACVANDEVMIDLFNNGCGDIHSLVAKMCYPQIDCPIEEIKHKYKGLRNKAKTYEFAINYFGDANTIFKNANGELTMEEAQTVYNNYMEGFKGMKTYRKFRCKDVMDKGYILINPIFGYISQIPDFDEWAHIKNEFNEEFWNKYREIKQKGPDDWEEQNILDRVQKYRKRKSDTEKQSGNYPIQGSSAIMFKLAVVYVWQEIVKRGWIKNCKPVAYVHDEMNWEVKEEIAEEFATIVCNCMEKAGKFLFKQVKFTATPAISDCWIH